MRRQSLLARGIALVALGLARAAPNPADCPDGTKVIEYQPHEIIIFVPGGPPLTSSSTSTRTYTIPPGPGNTVTRTIYPPGPPVTLTTSVPGTVPGTETIPPASDCSVSCTEIIRITTVPPPVYGPPASITTSVPGTVPGTETIPPASDCTVSCTGTVRITTVPPVPTPPFSTTVPGTMPGTETIPPATDCVTSCTTTIRVTTTPPPPVPPVSTTVPGTTPGTETVPPATDCGSSCTTTIRITTVPPPIPPVSTTVPGTTPGTETIPPATDCGSSCTTTIRVTTVPPETALPSTTSEPPSTTSATPSSSSSVESSSSATTSEPPTATFSCENGDGYLIQASTLYSVDLASGATNSVGSVGPGDNIQGIGYNHLDNLIYGCVKTAGTCRLIQIQADGSWELLDASVPNGDINTGDIDQQGRFWLSSADGTWYVIDVAPDSPTFGTIINQGTNVVDGLEAKDWAYVPGGGDYLYALRKSSDDATSATLARFSMSRGTWENLKTFTDQPGSAIGAVYAGQDGYLYFSENATGDIKRVQIVPSAGDIEKVSGGPISSQNDGARCIDSPDVVVTAVPESTSAAPATSAPESSTAVPTSEAESTTSAAAPTTTL